MIKKRQVREVVLDLETTGFAYNGRDRIIEIGVVELIDYDLTGNEFRRLVKPGRNEISPRITKLTGISNEDVAYEKMFKHPSVVVELIEFIGDSQIVAHNARFDRNFLNAELNRAGEKEFPKDRWIDTLRLAKETSLDLSSYKLDALCDQFRISRESRKSNHGALIDARLTARVYQRLLGSSGLTKQIGEDKKSKILKARTMHRNFNTPVSSSQSGKRSSDLESVKAEIEAALTSATGTDVGFGKNLPKNISAASQYFPIAILAMQLFRVAYAKIRSGREVEFEIFAQMERDKAEILSLIEMAEYDSDAMYEKLDAFHRSINQRR